MRATIVGAGVSGLTTAVALQNAGWDTRVVARETYESTVSMVAAAVWTATSIEPQQRTRLWAIESRSRFASIAEEPTSGVTPLSQRELYRTGSHSSWLETTPYVRRLEATEIPAGFGEGFAVDGFVMEPPIYLRWLTERLVGSGGEITRGEIHRLEEVGGDIVINCTGLGARQLADDPMLLPIRGQVVAVANPGIHEGLSDESDPDRISYAYPRSAELVLGGVRQAGRTDTAPDRSDTARILADCVRLDDRLAAPSVVDVRVGLRPGRPAVRVELELLADGRPVVHNYGHGGAGFILSWGCAREVVELAAARQ